MPRKSLSDLAVSKCVEAVEEAITSRLAPKSGGSRALADLTEENPIDSLAPWFAARDEIRAYSDTTIAADAKVVRAPRPRKRRGMPAVAENVAQ